MDCPFCGYDCSAVPSGFCPECGRPAFRYTERSREVIKLANEHACRLMTRPKTLSQWLRAWITGGVAFYGIACSHIAMAILTGPRGIGYHALNQLATDPNALFRELERLDLSLTRVQLPVGTRLPLRPSGRRITLQAIEQAQRLGHDWVGTEHLLLAICDSAAPSTRNCLARFGVTRDTVQAFVLNTIRNIKNEGPSNN
jgi:ATP-dependent Clp protease ATP-binding subunit ClpA